MKGPAIPPPTRDTAYDAAQFDDNFPPGIEHHFWFTARNRIVSRALRDVEQRGIVRRGARIMEIGCGTGVVVAGLLDGGHDVWGVEIGRPTPIGQAAPRIMSGVDARDLPASIRADVETLLFLDVIEHMPDDGTFLRDTVAAFPECRCVLITVPARPEVWSTHDTHYGHYRRYTPRSLDAAVQAAGLEKDRSRYLFRSLYGAAALLKGLGRDRDPVLRAPARRTLHHLVAAGLGVEDAVLRALPLPGLSLLATARVTPARA